MDRKYLGMSRQNIIFVLVMLAITALTVIYSDWLKANVPWFYPFRWVVFGIVVATGNFLNVLPGQVAAEDTSGQPLGRRALTFLGCVLFVGLVFASFDWVNEKYPQSSRAFRFAVLILMAFAWRWRAARLKAGN